MAKVARSFRLRPVIRPQISGLNRCAGCIQVVGLAATRTKKPGTCRASLPQHALPDRHRHPNQVHHVSNNSRRRIVSHHIATIVPILVSRRRWRTHPIRLRHRTNDISAREHSARHKHWALAASPPVSIIPVIAVEPSTIITPKMVVVTILLCLSRRNMVVITFLRLSRRHMVITIFLSLTRRYSAMSWRRIVRIASRRPLCNADRGTT